MKKILFLLLICLMNLNAYEYLVYDNKEATDQQTRYIFYTNPDGTLKAKRVYNDGHYVDVILTDAYNAFDQIKIAHSGFSYVTKSVFDSYYKNDFVFLNDLYITNDGVRNSFFNYLYNDNRFNSSNYILYENYELLYNLEGLAVESIVNGVWSGLYSDNEKSSSGKLYSKDGMLLYNNGHEVDYIQIFFDKLISKFDTTIVGVFWILGSVVAFGVIAYYVLDMLFFVFNIGKNVFTGLKYGQIRW